MKVFLQTKCYKIEIIYHICVWGLSIFFKSMKNLKNVKFEWEDVAFAFLYKILLLYIFVLKQPPSHRNVLDWQVFIHSEFHRKPKQIKSRTYKWHYTHGLNSTFITVIVIRTKTISSTAESCSMCEVHEFCLHELLYRM